MVYDTDTPPLSGKAAAIASEILAWIREQEEYINSRRNVQIEINNHEDSLTIRASTLERRQLSQQ